MNGWASGAQFVALNFQTKDVNMLINQSLFECNGLGKNCGYFLKTPLLRGLRGDPDRI